MIRTSRVPVDLSGRRFLVVEDEYFIAVEVCELLRAHGAEVVGPVPTVELGRRELEADGLDAAVLDVNLRGEPVFALADQLTRAGVPVLYVTGYDREALPDDRRNAVILGKPVNAERLVRAAADLIRSGRDAVSPDDRPS